MVLVNRGYYPAIQNKGLSKPTGSRVGPAMLPMEHNLYIFTS